MIDQGQLQAGGGVGALRFFGGGSQCVQAESGNSQPSETLTAHIQSCLTTDCCPNTDLTNPGRTFCMYIPVGLQWFA